MWVWGQRKWEFGVMVESEALEDETHAAHACNAIFALCSLLEHDIGFVLAEVELGLLGCWRFCHCGCLLELVGGLM